MKKAKPKPKDEFLGRFARHTKAERPGLTGTIPGHEGTRPQLEFVLCVLAGFDPGIVEFLLPLNLQVRTYPDTLGPLLSEPDSIPFIQTRMIAMMRLLADLWIDSGKDGANPGIDAPTNRNVLFARSEESPSIHDYLVRRLFDRHPRFMQVTLRGKLGVSDSFPNIEPHPVEHIYDRSCLESWGERLALYFFARFLDSPYSLHLSRCDDCGTFFAYERARQVTVKNGVHCDDCKLSDSVSRTKSRRDKLTRQMIDAAAIARMGWEESPGGPDLEMWILQQVNDEFATVLGKLKTKRWLTEHWNEILETVERRNDATRKN